MLTPSSNSVLEPVTGALLEGCADVTAHFSRFRVTEIGLSQAALGQFDLEPILTAADLLADARVAAILWNGTSGSWLGFDADERLCREIEGRTARPASTSTLAFRDLFQAKGFSRIGLVTPYTADVQRRIQATWRAAGFACTAERHLGLSENFAFAEVDSASISGMVRAVAAEGVDAVAIVCTNLAGAPLALELEAELNIPVVDSVAVTLWKGLRLAGRRMDDLAKMSKILIHD
ncbi:aspartate/glutamate racemase family protein [Methylobacterium symbioticum]|nr:aspartate/glutamate racemase family protein [Methylobacterium symbioticum]